MERGFVQSDGKKYCPNVLRVGAEEANMTASIREVEVGHKVRPHYSLNVPSMFPQCSLNHFVRLNTCPPSAVIRYTIMRCHLHLMNREPHEF